MINTRNDILLASWRPYLWLALACLILYYKTIYFGFTYLDDNTLILQNYGFLSKASNIARAFTQKVFYKSYLSYYRPILTISFMIDAQIMALKPAIYHLTNIFIHMMAAMLVFVFLVKMDYGRALAFFFAAIFAVHPMNAQAVAWIPGRNDSLLALFSLAFFIMLVDFMRRRTLARYLLHMFLFALAIFTKESALSLPIVALLYVALIARKHLLSRNVFALIAGYVMVISFWSALRNYAVRGSSDLAAYDMARYAINYFPAVIQFIGKALFPFNLSVFPIMQDTTFVYGICALFAIAAGLAISRKKRMWYISFGLLWLIAFIVPTLIRPHAGIVNDVLEHRFYLSMTGLFIVLAELDYFKKFSLHIPAQKILFSAVIILLSIATFIHIDNFKDRMTFWQSAVRSSPRSPFAHVILGSMYYMDGAMAAAETQFRKALELDNGTIRANYYMALVYMKKNMLKDAEKEIKKEIALYPLYETAYMVLGVLYYKEGKPKDAERMWQFTLTLDPENSDALRNLAIYYSETGEYEKSIDYVKRLQARGVTPPAEFLKKIGTK